MSENGQQVVVVVDSSPLFRLGISTCLRSTSPAVECETHESVMAGVKIQALEHVVLVGPHLLEHEAFSLCRALRHQHSDVPVVLMTQSQTDDLLAADAIEASFIAVVPVTITCAELRNLLSLTLGSWQHLTRSMMSRPTLGRLSPRERAVISMLSRGHSMSSIAVQLDRSTYTVRNHVQRILEKLDVHDQASAVRRAHRLGLIQDDR